jgi:hypothetical protein
MNPSAAMMQFAGAADAVLKAIDFQGRWKSQIYVKKY